ncbi:MAG: uroporphyrinogen-III C-methyltransferase [Anaerolineae bacterium]|nr:uroporphyrinogen-III C-methyltransferase [Anaerolineae bacterium]
MNQPGIVYIVGAGPGDPGLITVRGLNCLRQAEVIIHDRLIHPQLLEEAPAEAVLIDVGKTPGQRGVTQAEINNLLVQHGRGRVVVRLKGGDPFVFGRGGEECQALAAANIRYEVVPGISSALAVPAYAGIPVTHRDFGQSFTVVTGHVRDTAYGQQGWAALPTTGTLVILMGVSNLPYIAQALLDSGRPPDTPVAAIQNGTTAGQKIFTSTLADIGQQAAGVQSPATIVVGEVVSLGAELAWFNG